MRLPGHTNNMKFLIVNKTAAALIENHLTTKIADRLRHLEEETEEMPLENSMWGVAVIILVSQCSGKRHRCICYSCLH